MKKVFVTGCGGMVGSSLFKVFTEQGYTILATDKDVNEPWLQFLDVRDHGKAYQMIRDFKPDAVIHLAALTSLEYCEKNKEESWDVNYLATRNIAEICHNLNIPLVHISTAGIFDGEKEIYFEEDTPNPINVYGKTKLYGEIAVRNISRKSFIIRPGWMFGGGKKDKKFVSYIINQVIGGNKIFNVVNDKFGTPTYTYDLSRTIEKLINTEHYGVYHVACRGKTNRIEMAKHIIRLLGVDGAKINEVDSSFFKQDFSVPRASSERMVNKNLQEKGLDLMRPWEEAIEHYITTVWLPIISSAKQGGQ